MESAWECLPIRAARLSKRERGKMSGGSEDIEDNVDHHHNLTNHNHTSNHLKQYFFPTEPIPRLSVSDPLASQLISEEVSVKGLPPGVYSNGFIYVQVCQGRGLCKYASCKCCVSRWQQGRCLGKVCSAPTWKCH